MSHILALWNLDFRQDSEEKVFKLVQTRSATHIIPVLGK